MPIVEIAAALFIGLVALRFLERIPGFVVNDLAAEPYRPQSPAPLIFFFVGVFVLWPIGWLVSLLPF